MVQNQGFKKKAQVSIETLLLAGIIIMLSVSIFSFYTQIRDSTVAIELIKVKALKKIEERNDLIVLEKIDYKIDTEFGIVFFCVFTNPEEPLWEEIVEEPALEQLIDDLTGFAEIIDVQQNPDPSPCE